MIAWKFQSLQTKNCCFAMSGPRRCWWLFRHIFFKFIDYLVENSYYLAENTLFSSSVWTENSLFLQQDKHKFNSYFYNAHLNIHQFIDILIFQTFVYIKHVRKYTENVRNICDAASLKTPFLEINPLTL